MNREAVSADAVTAYVLTSYVVTAPGFTSDVSAAAVVRLGNVSRQPWKTIVPKTRG